MSLDLGANPRLDLPDDTSADAAGPGDSGAVLDRDRLVVPVAAVRRAPAAPLVTAVLISRDGIAHLPTTLTAVAEQTRLPDALAAADLGSRDGSAAMLDEVVAHVLRLPRRVSPGDAVQAVTVLTSASLLVQTEPARPGSDDQPRVPRPPGGDDGDGDGDGGDGGVEWLWLLTDDSRPAPTALERLLAAVEIAPSVAVAGCKQVDANDDQRLFDVGFTTTALGARITGLDRHEVDQGQHDGRSDVLAVSTAGMLVRRDVWDVLRGTDPGLANARDDLDLCHRVHLAGHRVVVVANAVVATSGRKGAARRTRGGRWHRADRRDALHLRLAGAPWPLLPVALVWVLPAAVGRALGRLLIRQPRVAVDELAAAATVLLRPTAWVRSRRRQRTARAVPRATLRPLLARPRQLVRQRRDELEWLLGVAPARRTPTPTDGTVPGGAVRGGAVPGGAVPGGAVPGGAVPDGTGEDRRSEPAVVDVAADGRRGAGQESAGETGPVDEDSESLPDLRRHHPRTPRRVGWLAALPVVAVTAAAGVVAMPQLLTGAGAAAGAYLVPAPSAAADLWRAALSSWRPLGLGATATADPFDTVLALLSAPLGQSPRLAVQALLLGALPLAALSAWVAAGALTSSRLLRGWAALAWAGAPTLLTAVTTGRPASVVEHVLLPLLALSLATAVGGGGRDPVRASVPAAAVAGLLLSVVLASAPSLAAPFAIVLVVLAVAVRRRAAVLLPVAAVPAVLLLPWWWAVARAPALLLADPGLPGAAAPLADPRWHLVLLPADPGALLGGTQALATRLMALMALMRLGSGGAGLDGRAAVNSLLIVAAAPVVLLGLFGLLRTAGAWAASVVAWAGALGALAAGALAERTVVGVTSAGAVHGTSVPALSLVTLGMLTAGLHGAQSGAGRLRSRSLGGGHLLAGLLALVCVTAPLAVLAAWAWQGRTDPAPRVRMVAADVLPAVAAAEAQGPAATRTLVLRISGGRVDWDLARASGPRLSDDSAALAQARTRSTGRSDQELIEPVLASLLADSGQDTRARLADLAVGSVLMLGPIDDAAVLALDASPGLVRVSTAPGAVLWRVELDASAGGPTRPARVRVLSRGGATLATLASQGTGVDAALGAGGAGRLLVLAERRDEAWQATLNGVALEPVTYAGWAQGFRLPAAGGRVSVVHQSALPDRAAPLRLAVALAALLVAIPLPGLRRRFVAPAPPAPSRPVVRVMAEDAPLQAPMPPRIFDLDHPSADPLGDDLSQVPAASPAGSAEHTGRPRATAAAVALDPPQGRTDPAHASSDRPLDGSSAR